MHSHSGKSRQFFGDGHPLFSSCPSRCADAPNGAWRVATTIASTTRPLDATFIASTALQDLSNYKTYGEPSIEISKDKITYRVSQATSWNRRIRVQWLNASAIWETYA